MLSRNAKNEKKTMEVERSPIAAEFMVVGETKIGKLLTYDLEVMKNILRT